MAVKSPEDFPARVNYACKVIIEGREPGRGFDDCFEMWDGDAVAVAVYRRSLKNPALAANIWRYLSRESVTECAEKVAHINNMAGEARRQRARRAEESRIWWEEFYRKQGQAAAPAGETTTNQGSLI